MQDEKITTLSMLYAAAVDGKSVVVPGSIGSWNRPHPAALMLNQSGSLLIYLFGCGMYVHEKEQCEDKFQNNSISRRKKQCLKKTKQPQS